MGIGPLPEIFLKSVIRFTVLEVIRVSVADITSISRLQNSEVGPAIPIRIVSSPYLLVVTDSLILIASVQTQAAEI